MSKSKSKSKNQSRKVDKPKVDKPKVVRPSETRTKKAFDLSRDSVYSADPITDLRLCGARGVVPPAESGDLDTPPGPDVPVKDEIRMRRPLSSTFLANVDRRSVRIPIVIAKIDDVATVIAGKRRVRAARASNRRRLEDGRPPMKIRCVMQRDTSSLGILQTIISENNAREDDTLADRVAKLKAYLAMGPSEDDAAVEFGVGVDRIRDWLDYDDHATDPVKEAVGRGDIPASTAMEIAKIKSCDAQLVALSRILGGTGTRNRSARAARAIAHGANGTPTVTDRKSQHMLLAYLQGHERRDGLGEFWRGVSEALKAVTGQKADALITKAISDARSEIVDSKAERVTDQSESSESSESNN